MEGESTSLPFPFASLNRLTVGSEELHLVLLLKQKWWKNRSMRRGKMEERRKEWKQNDLFIGPHFCLMLYCIFFFIQNSMQCNLTEVIGKRTEVHSINREFTLSGLFFDALRIEMVIVIVYIHGLYRQKHSLVHSCTSRKGFSRAEKKQTPMLLLSKV